ncbi:MAG: peptidoglycan DD-metalloendopeptidase family protein [Solirubrobacterales bacterium]
MVRFAAIPVAIATFGLTVAVAHSQGEPTIAPALADDDPAAVTTTPAESAPVALDNGGVGPGGDDGGNGDGGKGDGGKGDGGKGDGGSRGNRGKLRLLRADANPNKAWFKGRSAAFKFAIDGRRRRNVIVQVKRKGPEPAIVRRFEIDDVRPRKVRTVKWDGHTDGGKKYARQGTYKFKVRAKHGGPAVAKGAAGKPEAGFYKHKFPIRGAHTYGAGLGDGRGHRGVDVFARCGTPLQAARAGRVQNKAFQGSGAGHYLVIDGKKTGKDYVYMHMKNASRFAEGDKVRTGDRIGAVGETGSAQGCHLHFELWGAPGWYEGGEFLDPVPKMHAWDRWS